MSVILLVDDSFTARAIVGRIIGDAHTLVPVASGPEALAYLETSVPDIILLGLLMPGMDGFTVLKVLKEQGNRVPVLVLSADIQTSTRDRVLALGALGIINKPPRPDSFRKALEAVLTGTVP